MEARRSCLGIVIAEEAARVEVPPRLDSGSLEVRKFGGFYFARPLRLVLLAFAWACEVLRAGFCFVLFWKLYYIIDSQEGRGG